MKKIYCSRCFYLRDEKVCVYPDNCKGDWFAANGMQLKKPKKINGKNDCSWFRAR